MWSWKISLPLPWTYSVPAFWLVHSTFIRPNPLQMVWVWWSRSDHLCVLLINTKHTNSRIPFTNLHSPNLTLCHLYVTCAYPKVKILEKREKQTQCAVNFYKSSFPKHNSKEHNLQKNENITERQKKKPNLSDLTQIFCGLLVRNACLCGISVKKPLMRYGLALQWIKYIWSCYNDKCRVKIP